VGWLLAALALAAGAMIAYARKGEAATVSMPQATPEDVYERAARRFLVGVSNADADLLRAIAWQESRMRADAVRWKPPGDVSAGLMQILCTPPEGTEQGTDFVCQNRLPALGDAWPVRFSDLLDPEINVPIAAQILASNIRTWGFPRGLAVYNNWSARHAGVAGPFPNDDYVSSVLNRLSTLKGNTA
jgi:soluble lytic murein transglycosylase-like protein